MSNHAVPFFRASIGKEEEAAVLAVLKSGWLTTGEKALQFENDFSVKMNDVANDVERARKSLGLDTGAVRSFAVNSNTSGMILALDACGVAKGNAIITTPYTFVSTAACARHVGADVFFADIERDSYSIDVQKIENILKSNNGPRVKAIVPVHVAGNICNMEKICRLAKTYGVRVVEDAAHAFPSPTSLGYAGTIGDVGVFSFYATKTITTAEGGIVCTRDERIAKRIASMRLHGMDRAAWNRYTSSHASWKYDIIECGYKFNLPDVLAALGIEQLKKADAFFQKRKRIAYIYNEAFSSCDFITLPPDEVGNAWHLYLMRIVPEKLTISRDSFAKKLQERGIGISVHFIPLFHFTYWKKYVPDFTSQNFPNAEKQYVATISLPLWPDMSDSMVQNVINAVKEIGAQHHG
ncbi:MAG: DegT/DnrJ/EryC1/StrS aminotransferase family protein [Treponema sp.]|nr:DegT/DnrJ/EryC1/StrS aminotransferase family protein [Treponema sp.]